METRKSLGVEEKSSKLAMSNCFTWMGSHSSMMNLKKKEEREKKRKRKKEKRKKRRERKGEKEKRNNERKKERKRMLRDEDTVGGEWSSGCCSTCGYKGEKQQGGFTGSIRIRTEDIFERQKHMNSYRDLDTHTLTRSCCCRDLTCNDPCSPLIWPKCSEKQRSFHQNLQS